MALLVQSDLQNNQGWKRKMLIAIRNEQDSH